VSGKKERVVDTAEGMIVNWGGRFAGYAFYLLKGKPVFRWNPIDVERLKSYLHPERFNRGCSRIPPGFPLKACGNDESVGDGARKPKEEVRMLLILPLIVAVAFFLIADIRAAASSTWCRKI
jgi:hypothetical protein